ncbi:hypothetical protein WJX73_001891 [Symbiochloris irregularis]|uniref:Charged multivesicular body protein 6 n=1 Tax=Symbiochloris irregularis TaxID=706552 RepID=A0AAW1NPZ2_9CHLO
MGHLFSKDRHHHAKPKGEVTDVDKAVLGLKTQRRKLGAERKRVEAQIMREVQLAKEFIAAKRRERALLHMRKKKLHEQNADKIDAYLLNVEQVLANIETAQRQNQLFAALKQGNAAMADLRKELPLEDVEKLMAESAGHKEYEDQMRQILGESLTPEEDAAALEELQKLEEADDAEEAAELPEVPTHEVVPDTTQQQEAQQRAKTAESETPSRRQTAEPEPVAA